MTEEPTSGGRGGEGSEGRTEKQARPWQLGKENKGAREGDEEGP